MTIWVERTLIGAQGDAFASRRSRIVCSSRARVVVLPRDHGVAVTSHLQLSAMGRERRCVVAVAVSRRDRGRRRCLRRLDPDGACRWRSSSSTVRGSFPRAASSTCTRSASRSSRITLRTPPAFRCSWRSRSVCRLPRGQWRRPRIAGLTALAVLLATLTYRQSAVRQRREALHGRHRPEPGVVARARQSRRARVLGARLTERPRRGASPPRRGGAIQPTSPSRATIRVLRLSSWRTGRSHARVSCGDPAVADVRPAARESRHSASRLGPARTTAAEAREALRLQPGLADAHAALGVAPPALGDPSRHASPDRRRPAPERCGLARAPRPGARKRRAHGRATNNGGLPAASPEPLFWFQAARAD